MRSILVLVAAARISHAEPAATAIAVNEPLGWKSGEAFGGSVYQAITSHQVLRVNVATWKQNAGDFGGDLALISVEQFGTNGFASGGRNTDVGAAWMYFPRRAYDGPSLELGAFVRWRDTYLYDDDFTTDRTTTVTTTVAGRALAGWSWLGWDRVFVSLQVGVSVGRETGTATHDVHPATTQPMETSVTSVGRVAVAPEAFMRFGVLL